MPPIITNNNGIFSKFRLKSTIMITKTIIVSDIYDYVYRYVSTISLSLIPFPFQTFFGLAKPKNLFGPQLNVKSSTYI